MNPERCGNIGVAVRAERAVGWFGEVAGKYDIDGVELDYFRHPIFFKS